MHHPRRGVSLLEVLVALAIFLMALIGIGHLLSFGSDRALDVQHQAIAIKRCQSQLAQVACGAIPLNSQGETPFDEDPDWHWSMDAQQGNITGLWTVTIHVTRPGPSGSKIDISLTQMVLDPSLRGSAVSAAPSSSSGTSGSGTGGTGASGGTAGGSGRGM
jgi:prepilin-type N-terminal cleavage/methylation domain-containing protein